MRYQFRYDEQIRHLLDQLRPRQLDEMDDKFRLQCPFPDHRDSTPSFYISRRLGAYHCLAGATRVLTPRGAVEIGQLAGRSELVLAPSKPPANLCGVGWHGTWQRVAFHAYGRQRLWEIVLTRNGRTKTLHATDQHRWFTCRGTRVVERTTKQLRAGHTLCHLFPQPQATRPQSSVLSPFGWQVQKVHSLSTIEEVYCAEVPGAHAFTLEDNILTGNCFGCRRHGSLKRLAQEMNLTLPDSDETDINGDETDHWVFTAQDLDPDLLDSDTGLAIDGVPLVIEVPRLLRPFPQQARWRGLSAKLLAALEAKLWYDDTIPGCEIERIWFPVQQEHVLSGWFARVLSRREHKHHPRKDDIPKYRNNDNQRTKQLLFPYDYVRARFARRHTVAVVEGQVDALTLIQADIPALAIFGTNNWSEYKEGLLAGAGFTNVIVAMDGDKPGRKLQVELVPKLRRNFDRVFDFRVPHHHDPASMPPEYRAQLRRLSA